MKRQFVLISACALTLSTLPSPDLWARFAQDSSSTEILQKAKAAEASGRADESIAAYQAALKANPSASQPQLHLAELYFQRGDYEQALAYSEKLLTTNPHESAAGAIAGKAAYQLNRYRPAAKYLQTALAAEPHDSQLHYWLGMTLYAMLDPRHALDEFYRARLYNPKDTETLYMIGKVHWEMCRQAWEEMVRVDPDSVRVKQMVAEQDEIRNLYPEAIAKYQEIIQQAPAAPGFHYALGNVYLHLTQFAEAQQAFEEELKLDTHSSQAYYGLAEVAFERQDLPTALADSNHAIEAKPDYGDAYVLRGRIELGMGDKQKAMETLEHAATLSPQDASVYYVLGRVYTDLGRRDLAEKAYATYQQLKGEQEKEIQVAR
jgi:tetratricopeptide (TPR) repeat protein